MIGINTKPIILISVDRAEKIDNKIALLSDGNFKKWNA